MLYKLAGGDLSKADVIANTDVETCYDWYYLLKIKDLNEVKVRVAEWERIREDNLARITG